MRKNRPISMFVAVALLLSLFAPLGASAEHCAGTSAVVEALAATAHDHANPAHHSSGSGHHHDDAGHHEAHDHAAHGHAAEPPATPVAEKGDDAGAAPSADPPNRFSYCCTDGSLAGIVARLATPTLTKVQSNLTVPPVVAALHPWIGTSLDNSDRLLSRYKIDSSPPEQAVADQYTYLRTSVLLI